MGVHKLTAAIRDAVRARRFVVGHSDDVPASTDGLRLPSLQHGGDSRGGLNVILIDGNAFVFWACEQACPADAAHPFPALHSSRDCAAAVHAFVLTALHHLHSAGYMLLCVWDGPSASDRHKDATSEQRASSYVAQYVAAATLLDTGVLPQSGSPRRAAGRAGTAMIPGGRDHTDAQRALPQYIAGARSQVEAACSDAGVPQVTAVGEADSVLASLASGRVHLPTLPYFSHARGVACVWSSDSDFLVYTGVPGLLFTDAVTLPLLEGLASLTSPRAHIPFHTQQTTAAMLGLTCRALPHAAAVAGNDATKPLLSAAADAVMQAFGVPGMDMQTAAAWARRELCMCETDTVPDAECRCVNVSCRRLMYAWDARDVLHVAAVVPELLQAVYHSVDEYNNCSAEAVAATEMQLLLHVLSGVPALCAAPADATPESAALQRALLGISAALGLTASWATKSSETAVYRILPTMEPPVMRVNQACVATFVRPLLSLTMALFYGPALPLHLEERTFIRSLSHSTTIYAHAIVAALLPAVVALHAPPDALWSCAPPVLRLRMLVPLHVRWHTFVCVVMQPALAWDASWSQPCVKSDELAPSAAADDLRAHARAAAARTMQNAAAVQRLLGLGASFLADASCFAPEHWFGCVISMLAANHMQCVSAHWLMRAAPCSSPQLVPTVPEISCFLAVAAMGVHASATMSTSSSVEEASSVAALKGATVRCPTMRMAGLTTLFNQMCDTLRETARYAGLLHTEAGVDAPHHQWTSMHLYGRAPDALVDNFAHVATTLSSTAEATSGVHDAHASPQMLSAREPVLHFVCAPLLHHCLHAIAHIPSEAADAPAQVLVTLQPVLDCIAGATATARKMVKLAVRRAPDPAVAATSTPTTRAAAASAAATSTPASVADRRQQRPGGGEPLATPSSPAGSPALPASRSAPTSSTPAALPIAAHVETILRAVAVNTVTIIKADTGAGKSSQVPQYILDASLAITGAASTPARRGKATSSAAVNSVSGARLPPASEWGTTPPSLFVTQPRRMAAVTLAQRVADERHEKVGGTVGYRIGQDGCSSSDTRITFATTGWLLQLLVHQSNEKLASSGSLDRMSHIILDEVHERGIDTDILCLIIKLSIARDMLSREEQLAALRGRRHEDLTSFSALLHAQRTRIILMSATIDVTVFVEYFTDFERLWQQAARRDRDAAYDAYDRMRRSVSTFSPSLPPPAVLHVGAKRYPVKTVFLEDVYDQLPRLAQSELRGQSAAVTRFESTATAWAARSNGNMAVGDALSLDERARSTLARLAARIALHVAEPGTGDCILVFVAGMADIDVVCDAIIELGGDAVAAPTAHLAEEEEEELDAMVDSIEHLHTTMDDDAAVGSGTPGGGDAAGVRRPPAAATPFDKTRIRLLPMHSLISFDDQLSAWDTTDTRTRIVVATNIAESSITLPNVHTVIDFGRVKSIEYVPKTRNSMLRTTWVSKASALQRAGRAGRVRPGTVYRMYTEKFHDVVMPKYDTPEMLRLSLDAVVLRVKMLGGGLQSLISNRASDAEASAGAEASPYARTPSRHSASGAASVTPAVPRAKDVLALCLQPPDMSSVDAALQRLASMGALAQASDEAEITPFGRMVAAFPGDIAHARVVAFGALMGVLPDAVILAAALSAQDIFMAPHSALAESATEYMQLMHRGMRARWLLNLVPGSLPGGDAAGAHGDGGIPEPCERGVLSDPIVTRNAYIMWRAVNSHSRTKWCMSVGIIGRRMMGVHSAVREYARRLMKDMPWSRRLMQALLSGDAREGDATEAPSDVVWPPPGLFTTDIDRLRLVMAAGLIENLAVGTQTQGTPTGDARARVVIPLQFAHPTWVKSLAEVCTLPLATSAAAAAAKRVPAATAADAASAPRFAGYLPRALQETFSSADMIRSVELIASGGKGALWSAGVTLNADWEAPAISSLLPKDWRDRTSATETRRAAIDHLAQLLGYTCNDGVRAPTVVGSVPTVIGMTLAAAAHRGSIVLGQPAQHAAMDEHLLQKGAISREVVGATFVTPATPAAGGPKASRKRAAAAAVSSSLVPPPVGEPQTMNTPMVGPRIAFRSQALRPQQLISSAVDDSHGDAGGAVEGSFEGGMSANIASHSLLRTACTPAAVGQTMQLVVAGAGLLVELPAEQGPTAKAATRRGVKLTMMLSGSTLLWPDQDVCARVMLLFARNVEVGLHWESRLDERCVSYVQLGCDVSSPLVLKSSMSYTLLQEINDLRVIVSLAMNALGGDTPPSHDVALRVMTAAGLHADDAPYIMEGRRAPPSAAAGSRGRRPRVVLDERVEVEALPTPAAAATWRVTDRPLPDTSAPVLRLLLRPYRLDAGEVDDDSAAAPRVVAPLPARSRSPAAPAAAQVQVARARGGMPAARVKKATQKSTRAQESPGAPYVAAAAVASTAHDSSRRGWSSPGRGRGGKRGRGRGGRGA